MFFIRIELNLYLFDIMNFRQRDKLSSDTAFVSNIKGRMLNLLLHDSLGNVAFPSTAFQLWPRCLPFDCVYIYIYIYI